jgi:hypothetical protein
VEIGYDPDADRRRGLTLSGGGVVVVARGERIDAGVPTAG